METGFFHLLSLTFLKWEQKKLFIMLFKF